MLAQRSKTTPKQRQNGSQKKRKLKIFEDRSGKSTFLKHKRLGDEISANALNQIRKGKLVLIDMNTKSNFRTAKLPRIHTVLSEDEIMNQQERRPIEKMTNQLCIDMNKIRLKKKRLSLLLNGEVHPEQDLIFPKTTNAITKSYTESLQTENQEEMTEWQRSVLKKQQKLLNSGPPLKVLRSMLVKKFSEIRQSMK